MILALRTDKPEAELHLFDANREEVDKLTWLADRKLADTLLTQIQNMLHKNNSELTDLTDIIVFTGEGSFTGLRIGSTVANTLAYSYDIPVVSSEGKDWVKDGLQNLLKAQPGNYVVPKYHSEPNITTPKKLSLEDPSK